MSSDTYDRATVDTSSDSKGRIRGLIDTLQGGLTQTIETVSRQSRFEISGGNVDQVDAPDDLDELVDLAKSVGFVWQAYQVFANEVWKPGYRLEAESEETLAFFLGDADDIDATPPQGTPEGGFLNNAAVFAGEKHQDFGDLGKTCTMQRRMRGTVIIELLKADPENPESEITGFYLVRPETVSAETYPNTNILIDPEDTDQPGVEITKRGEAAAYIQFDDNSIIGRRNDGMDNDEIPLSQNDVHKQVLNPGIGDDASEEQGIFGTPGLRPISEDIAEYKQIKRDRATAIQTKAYGVWAMEFGRESLDLGNGTKEIIEWDDDDMDSQVDEIGNLEPGQIAAYDGTINLKKFESEVPDLDDTLKHYVDDIFAGLPVSKYKVGFADEINRDVTSEQSESDNDEVKEERQYQERQWTQVLREVANRKGLDTTGLQLKIAPEPSDSPIMSMTTEEIERLATYADALNSLAGPQGGPQTLIDEETLLTEVAQLPESVASVDDIEAPENAEDTLAEFQDIMGMDAEVDTYAAGEGDVVELPSGGKGVVVMEGGEDVEIDGKSVGENEVVVAYASQQGYKIIEASELSSASFDVPEDTDPEAVKDAMAHDAYAELEKPSDPVAIDVLVGTGIGFDSWPDSWEDADVPARVIALDAWASMGGTWSGCFRELRDKRVCSAFKDEILGTTEWR